MNLLQKQREDVVSNSDIEHVELHKQEYKLIGSFMRTKGLRLYSFNPQDESLHEVKMRHGDTIHVEIQDGKMVCIDKEMQKAVVDTRFIYFECLNRSSAKRRVHRSRQSLGKLCNLIEYSGNKTIEL